MPHLRNLTVEYSCAVKKLDRWQVKGYVITKQMQNITILFAKMDELMTNKEASCFLSRNFYLI